MFYFLIISFVFLGPIRAFGDGRIRTVPTQKDQIVTIKAAIGVATIIQVPDTPTSVVLGDQSAFKIEYLDRAITIKPLREGARSNLYIYTDYRRFDVQLATTGLSAADYVVYLVNSNQKEKESKLVWTRFQSRLKNESLFLETKRIAQARSGILLVEFEVTSGRSESFKPEWIWLTQAGITRPIHSLALSGQELGPKARIKGILQILKKDVFDKKILHLEIRRKKISVLTLPRMAAWR